MNTTLSDNFVRFLINLALFLLLIIASYLSLAIIAGLAFPVGVEPYQAGLAFALALLPLPILLTLIRRLINKKASAVWSFLKFSFWVYVIYTSLILIIGLINRT
ncbi:MAG: hypothetical protein HYU80_02450 [Candidatus Blackburnbacteria bacterium]|nr:hypothetical protein [Candidatus Blackburnbacteria bacterium]